MSRSHHHRDNFTSDNIANRGLDKDLKKCDQCGGHFFVSEVHSCVGYLQALIKEIVGNTSFDAAV